MPDPHDAVSPAGPCPAIHSRIGQCQLADWHAGPHAARTMQAVLQWDGPTVVRWPLTLAVAPVIAYWPWLLSSAVAVSDDQRVVA